MKSVRNDKKKEKFPMLITNTGHNGKGDVIIYAKGQVKDTYYGVVIISNNNKYFLFQAKLVPKVYFVGIIVVVSPSYGTNSPREEKVANEVSVTRSDVKFAINEILNSVSLGLNNSIIFPVIKEIVLPSPLYLYLVS